MASAHFTLSDDPRVDLRPELPDDDPAGDSLAEAFDGETDGLRKCPYSVTAPYYHGIPLYCQ